MKLSPSQLYGLAEHAYNAYGADADWTAYDGRVMVAWADMRIDTRRHWVAATTAVVNSVEKYFDTQNGLSI